LGNLNGDFEGDSMGIINRDFKWVFKWGFETGILKGVCIGNFCMGNLVGFF